MLRFLTVIPVHNEESYIEPVLRQVLNYAPRVLVVDDGSTDATPSLLKNFPDVVVLRHDENLGYGAALRSGFQYAIEHGYDCVVTMDCDGQHQPHLIPRLLRHLPDADIVSGSRYLIPPPPEAPIPPDRRRINQYITRLLNELFGWHLTDAFCGFKAYQRHVLERLTVTEPGYAMPLEVWVQAAHYGWRIREVPVPVIYLDESRAFGGALDDPQKRLNHYLDVLRRAVDRWMPQLLERLPDVEVVLE